MVSVSPHGGARVLFVRNKRHQEQQQRTLFVLHVHLYIWFIPCFLHWHNLIGAFYYYKMSMHYI